MDSYNDQRRYLFDRYYIQVGSLGELQEFITTEISDRSEGLELTHYGYMNGVNNEMVEIVDEGGFEDTLMEVNCCNIALVQDKSNRTQPGATEVEVEDSVPEAAHPTGTNSDGGTANVASMNNDGGAGIAAGINNDVAGTAPEVSQTQLQCQESSDN
mmetsp:Transcript_7039/g.17333  ORF Transcript_7039/g.17333 Transcript_7039/m.17333 type:complete len:157 (+) Transcript_7039:1124-1594(+)